MPRQKKCKVQLYTRFGFESEPKEFDSISDGIRWAKENGSWRYVVFVDGHVSRHGYCVDYDRR